MFSAPGTIRVKCPCTCNVQCPWHYHKVHSAVFFLMSGSLVPPLLIGSQSTSGWSWNFPPCCGVPHGLHIPLGTEWIVTIQVTASPTGNWEESSCTIGVCDGVVHCLMSACQPHCKCHTLTSVLLLKEIIFHMTSAVSHQPANMCWLMVFSPQWRVATNVTKQLSATPVSMGSCSLAIGPTLGARIGLSWVYHPI